MSSDKRVIADIPNFPAAHDGLPTSYRGQRKYPQVIEQSKLAGLAHKNQAELGAAMDEGFHSAGWPGALHKAIEISLAQRKSTAEYVSPYGIAQLNADLGNKDTPSSGSTPPTRSTTQTWSSFPPTSRWVHCAPIPLHRTGAQNWTPTIATVAVAVLRIPLAYSRLQKSGCWYRAAPVTFANDSGRMTLVQPLPNPVTEGRPTFRAQLGDSDLKPILDAKSQRQGAGEASLEVEQPHPFRCNGDSHHLLNH